MRIFISAGEPSGDLHGSNLVRELLRQRSDVECVGFGGDRMAAAGCVLLYPLCRLSVMWFLRVFTNILTFLRLLRLADRYFEDERPDAVVLIDYPGFHWLLAKRAKKHGIPVYYFVPPQLWAWAGWRVKKVKRLIDHVLCSLPFERDWYAERGVVAEYVGHPYFDELTHQQLDPAFLAEQRAKLGPVVALLPGSRMQEVHRNFPMFVEAAKKILAARPDARFLVPSFNADQREVAEGMLVGSGLPVELHVGRTPEIIALAEVCIAVSGSVGLELLFRDKPTVVAYRIRKLDLFIARPFIKARFISLVNLLAGEELFPEYLTDRSVATEAAGHVSRWLNDPAAMAEIRDRLRRLRERVAEPGACERAATFVLATLRAAKPQAA